MYKCKLCGAIPEYNHKDFCSVRADMDSASTEELEAAAEMLDSILNKRMEEQGIDLTSEKAQSDKTRVKIILFQDHIKELKEVYELMQQFVESYSYKEDLYSMWHWLAIDYGENLYSILLHSRNISNVIMTRINGENLTLKKYCVQFGNASYLIEAVCPLSAVKKIVKDIVRPDPPYESYSKRFINTKTHDVITVYELTTWEEGE